MRTSIDDDSQRQKIPRSSAPMKVNESRKATLQDLDKLEVACQPATFSVKKASTTSPTARREDSGQIDVVRHGPLEGVDDEREIKMELHKLNVYGLSSTSISLQSSSNDTMSMPAPHNPTPAYAFSKLVTNDRVLPDGEYLGIGLRRQYSVRDGTHGTRFCNYLKDPDVALG
ncbi:hypothetical protein F5141DRAFT_1068773 [Pisolithus sp. B1]|nr:hypothetical protein F5141DRAFT_1068773 [Pisolithus sp. B1]